jgi:cyanophycinase
MSDYQQRNEPQSAGTLLAIGGAEDRLRDRRILRRFVELAGDDRAHVAILPTATRYPDAGERYQRLFLELGAGCAEVIDVTNREDAEQEQWGELIDRSSGVFITGGNQVRLASIIGGTRVNRSIERVHRSGAPIAGTSAGASVMSTVMVAGGHSGATPRRNMARMSRGLGLIDSVIIDQHFTERNRTSRLVAMVSYNPGLIGLGIDEDTAAIIQPDGEMEVLGRGSVLIVDGSRMVTNIYLNGKKKPPTIANVTIHFVGDGGRFDLEKRELLSIS